MDELHEGLEVLRGGGTGEAVRVVAERELRATLLTGEGLLQVGGHERAEGALREHDAGELHVAALGIGQDGVTTIGGCREHNLVGIEVGLLHQYGSTVGEGELGEAEGSIGFFLLDGAGLRGLCHEGLLLHIVDIGLEGLLAHGVDGALHVLGLVVLIAFLLGDGSEADEVGVGERDELLGEFVDGLNGNHRGNLLHELVLVFDGDDGLGIDEVLHVLLAVAVGRGLLAVVVGLLNLAEIFRAGTVVLRSGEAEVVNALQLAHGGSKAFHVLTFTGHHLQGEGILRTRHEVLLVAGTSLHERAVGLLSLLGEAGTHHVAEHAAHVVVDEVLHALLHLIGEGVVLHGSEDDAHLLLLVLADEINAFVVVGNGHNLYLRSIGRHLDIAEERLDLAFDVVDVDVANDDDGLVVGTIPLAIVSAQRLRRAAVDDAHQTNGEALAIERTGIELRQQSLKDFLQADDAHAILVVHDVALGIDGFLGERDAVRPVFQNHHA